MTVSLTRSSRSVLALAAVCLLVTSACSEDEDPAAGIDTSLPRTTLSAGLPTASGAPSAPAGLPTDAPTALPASGAQVAGAEIARRVDAAAAAKGTVAFDVIASGAESITGTGVAKGSGTSSQAQLEVVLPGGNLGIVKTGPDVFFRTPQPLQGKAWLKLSSNPEDPLSKIYSQAFLGLDNLSDVRRIASFVKGMGRFTEAAKEQVDGVTTTKYVGQPAPAKAVRMLGGPYQNLSGEGLKGAKATVALWVDDEGLLRRSTVVFTVRDNKPAQTLVSYKNWGQPVTVQAPPAGQVLTWPVQSP